MEGQNNNSKLKAIIVILAILLAGSLAYMWKMSSDAKTTQTTLVTEKESVMKDLEALKATYDQAIAENTSMSDELIAEREKVVKLMAELEKSKGDVAALSKYRAQYRELEGKMKNLMVEVETLKKENAGLVVERDSTVKALGEQKKFNDTLVIQNENLAKTVEKGSQLTVMNLRTQAVKERSSGKLVETERARRVDKLKVCFTVAENKIAKSGEKTYYVQVIDPKNNVLGDKQTVNFGDQTLTYSFTTTTNYENKAVDVCELLAGKDFEKGAYFVNIFDKNELVSKTSFTLK
ncbi:GAS domain-containing protein [Flavobacterium silvaticum]|uniref:Chromosome partitioning protein ParA n=1 Tax=Flavobacterium silvaticum TaxID=1852020 RepID=A0A972FWT5_9FLAO|nr:hypothetical protein [Flavobacterium silvaticum]NMH29090.1 hypothetical protein [Flavobacterium silvaticum]